MDTKIDNFLNSSSPFVFRVVSQLVAEHRANPLHDPVASECEVCGLFECGEPLHFHHDGCPNCDVPLNFALTS